MESFFVESSAMEDDGFAAWLEQVKQEAIQRGISKDIVLETLTDVRPSQRIMELDQNQPEIKLTAEAYLKRFVDENRICNGLESLEDNRELLENVSSEFGIPVSIMTAIWGIESNYGSIQGSWNVIQAVVTLAYASLKPTRAAYFRGELFHVLFILVQGQGPADAKGLKGSWAGAMGQCQFMPSSYRSYAVDYDKDGRADIWTSKADVLASMANYLLKHGWKSGGHFAQKVHLPPDVDESQFGFSVTKEVHEWISKDGVIPDGILHLPENEMASLVAPDGPSGLSYLACENFRVVMRYNTSPLYCMAVYELAQEIHARAAKLPELSV